MFPVKRLKPTVLIPLPRDPDDPTPPFTDDIKNVHISRKFKISTIKVYDGMDEPANHIRILSNALLLQPDTDDIKSAGYFP